MPAKPVVNRWFSWIDKRFAAQCFFSRSPITAALACLRERRSELKAYLHDSGARIELNYLIRALCA